MADQQYCLRWNNHQNTLISVFDSLQERGCMVDCTLGAEGKSLQAHKVVLSACSPYLEDLLTKHYDKHPILILKDVRFEELKAMVDYMYRGEVNVAHDKLNTFLQAAESLQIKGLSDSRNDPPDTGGTAGGTKRTSKGAPVSVRSSQQLTVRSTNLADESRDGSVSPSQRKRRRRRGSEESETDSSSNVADGKQSSAAVAPVTGPSILNQDLLPSVPASGPADALLSSIMESAETETAPDSGIFTNAVTPSSQENVIQDKGSSDILIEPKTEYLDDDTQDLPLGDDDSGPGPSHSRSGNFMNDSDMFMADQDGTNAQGSRRRQPDASTLHIESVESLPSWEKDARRCPQCGQRFRGRRDVARHLARKTGPKKCRGPPPAPVVAAPSPATNASPFKTPVTPFVPRVEILCGLCPYNANNQKVMAKHMSLEHPKERPFKCKQCTMTFRLSTSLASHYCSYHADSIPKGILPGDVSGCMLTKRRSGGLLDDLPKLEVKNIKVERKDAVVAAVVEAKPFQPADVKADVKVDAKADAKAAVKDAVLPDPAQVPHSTRQSRQEALVQKHINKRARKQGKGTQGAAIKANRLRQVKRANYRLLCRPSPSSSLNEAPTLEAEPKAPRTGPKGPKGPRGPKGRKKRGRGRCKRPLELPAGEEEPASSKDQAPEQASSKEQAGKAKEKGPSSAKGDENDDDDGDELVEDDSRRVVHEDIYKCTECDARFRHAMQLEMHELEHETGGDSGVGALFECILCGRAFALEETLRWHIEAEHTVGLGAGAALAQPAPPPRAPKPTVAPVIDLDGEVEYVEERRPRDRKFEVVEIADDDDEDVVAVVPEDAAAASQEATALVGPSATLDSSFAETPAATTAGTGVPGVGEDELKEAVGNILAGDAVEDGMAFVQISEVTGAAGLVNGLPAGSPPPGPCSSSTDKADFDPGRL